jgi:glutaredoxin
MKKVVPLLLVGVLVLSGLGASVVSLQPSHESVLIDVDTEHSPLRGTHTAFGEYGTATWCGYCKYAHGALKELYAEGQLDFNYVTLVCDKNSVAYNYAKTHFNLYGYPTVWWDGGYKVNVGAGSVASAKSTYTSSITQCVARAVKDVDITLEVTWLDGTEMQVSCQVKNNEATAYAGTIRVYITEKESSMNWKDTSGALYTHAFLAFAFNQAISIPAGGTWSNSMNWVGSANGFPTVTKQNTMVIAAVENDEWHQGYSYPPSTNPFDAYYVDECVTVDFTADSPPNTPLITGPATGKIKVALAYNVTTTDPDGDDVSYFIDWGDGSTSGWLGPYSSGDVITQSHTWSKKRDYTIKAKARDIYGNESNWGELTVTIPYSYTLPFTQLWIRVFERFPNVFLLLRHLMGY